MQDGMAQTICNNEWATNARLKNENENVETIFNMLQLSDFYPDQLRHLSSA